MVAIMPGLLTRRALRIDTTRLLSIKSMRNTLIPTLGKRLLSTTKGPGGRVGGIGWSDNRQSKSLRHHWALRKAIIHGWATRLELMFSRCEETDRVSSRSYGRR